MSCWRNSEDANGLLYSFLYFPFLENGMKVGNVRYQLRKMKPTQILRSSETFCEKDVCPCLHTVAVSFSWST